MDVGGFHQASGHEEPAGEASLDLVHAIAHDELGGLG